MFTIFTIPKSFENNHISIIQKNAIKSWKKIVPQPEIFLFGDDSGVEDTAKELNVKCIKNVEKNQFGTPLLNFIFNYIENNSSFTTLCYVNCDIIFFPDIVDTLKNIYLKKYLLIGQRWDLDINYPVDFDDPYWNNNLKNQLKINGKLHEPAGSDYFIYKKGTIKNFPPFCVGRRFWDNWVIYYFLKNNIKVIDATKKIFIIHQNHDYSHIKNGNGKSYLGTESDNNKKYYPFNFNFTIEDANYYIDDNFKIKKTNLYNLRKIYQMEVFHPILWFIFTFIKKIIKKIFIRANVNFFNIIFFLI